MVEFPNFSIESECIKQGYKFVAGTDEVGYGALCGNVFSCCAVILNINDIPKNIKESKGFKGKYGRINREKIYEELIKNKSVLYGIGEGSVEEIDKYNVKYATKLSMERAYNDLVKKYNVKPKLILVDGNLVKKYDIGKNLNVETKYIIKGDEKSITIAIASIIAKVSRDRVLKEMDMEYPMYDWKNNCGYAGGKEKTHIEAIKKYGHCKYHRGKTTGKSAYKNRQQLLFALLFCCLFFTFC
ncbi:MAG: ribonuclease HII [Rickettsiales bacterium]|jgi:ribonuclease HII|nr:ribonuclease HII [Rickettsiales bacterium]